MAAAGRRFTVWLLLGGYLFAVTAATSFHRHGTHGRWAIDSHDACDHAGHGVLDPPCRHDCRHDPSEAAVGRGEGSSLCSSHDSCPVCQFLSLKVLATQPVVAICSEVLPEAAIVRLPAPVVAARRLIHYSRAPPSLA